MMILYTILLLSSFHVAQSASSSSSSSSSKEVIKQIVTRGGEVPWVDLKGSSKVTSVFERGPGFWTTPADEDATEWHKKLTPPKSQREHWYKVSPYIAEFWCTLSNLGFIYVGIEQQCPELIFAGVASMLSHSIPKLALLRLDFFGILVAATVAARKYDTLIEHPWLAIPVAGAYAVNNIDSRISRKKPTTVPHVFWHLYAAFVSRLFLQYASADLD